MTQSILRAADRIKAQDSEIARLVGRGSQPPYTAPVHPGGDGQFVTISDGVPSGGEDANFGDIKYDLHSEEEHSGSYQYAMSTMD